MSVTFRKNFMTLPLFWVFTKVRMVAGRDAMDWAKMMGITPDMFTLMGRNVLCPPYILRPRICLAYWMGMRRSASLTKTISTTSASASTRMTSTATMLIPPPMTLVMAEETVLGIREMMEANRMMEIPLPMPNSVICSPSHMMNAEPAVKVSTMTRPVRKPRWVSMP